MDDYSHYGWIIPLRAKYKSIDVYVAFDQFGKKIKIFHSDGDGEFVNKRLAFHF